MIGVIGGSGLESYSSKEYVKEANCSPYCIINISGIDIVFMSRHGVFHGYMPHEIPYAENIKKLKELGCDTIISFSACGSLNENISPGTFVCPDGLVDWKREVCTITGKHTEMGEIFDLSLRKRIINATDIIGCSSLVSIPGPRFSTRAESRMFKQLGFDIINMTTSPEAFLAKELGIKYVVINMVTDYDSWREGNSVTYEQVLKQMETNVERFEPLLEKILVELSK